MNVTKLIENADRKPKIAAQLKPRSHEELAKYWDEGQNGMKLSKVTNRDRKLYHWFHVADCGCRHEWMTLIYSMEKPRKDSKAIGCLTCHKDGEPCCANNPRGLESNVRFQEIREEWSPINKYGPDHYYSSSNEVVEWIHKSTRGCDCIHVWKAPIYSRISGRDCPTCAGNQGTSPCCSHKTVKKDAYLMSFWHKEKNERLGLKPSQFLLHSNIKVWWKCNRTCKENLNCKHEWFTGINAMSRHTKGKDGSLVRHGCKFCLNESEFPCCYLNSLAAPIYSKIVEELHPESKILLGDLTLIYPASNREVKWICKKTYCDCSHDYQTTINRRVKINSSEPKHGCHKCSSCVEEICCIKHPRSIMNFPDKIKLAIMMNSCKKRNIDLKTIPIMSGRKIEIDCDECDHTFVATISNITNPKKLHWCYYCAIGSSTFCDKKDCDHCHAKSFASFKDESKIQSYIKAKNPLTPNKITKHSHQLVNLYCEKCKQIFCSRLSRVTLEKNPGWCPVCATTRTSSVACRYLDALENKWKEEKNWNYKIQHIHITVKGRSGSEFRERINNVPYGFDGFIAEKKIAIEFHGDYYHGNPKFFPSDRIFHGAKTFGDCYKLTKRKMKDVSSKYKLYYVWEYEFRAWEKDQSLPLPCHEYSEETFE